jgi:hypothetical protein
VDRGGDTAGADLVGAARHYDLVLKMDAAERRRRLGPRHALSTAVDDPVEVARRVVALHGTDPASVFLAVAARTAGVGPSAIEGALYERRELVRMLGMRRTMFVVPAEVVPVIEKSTMERIAATQRKLLLKQLRENADDGPADPGPWLQDVERSVLRALAARGGSATAAQLSADEPRLRTTLHMSPGKAYEAHAAITSRVLLLLGAEGRIVRGRPSGSWLSQRYEWALAETWVPAAAAPATAEAARAELARRWLAAFGPAPVADLQWWTGWTGAQAKRAVADLDVVEVDLGASDIGASDIGVVLAEDTDPTAEPQPWAALLPALDPTVMGWSRRDWFLGDHGPALFDRAGNAGPSVWLDGRIVGGWAQRADGEIVLRLFQDVGADGTRLIEAEVAQLTKWLGDVRIIPRFRTPTERELVT